MTAEPTELVTAIHATAPRMTMNFAGAGSLALAWLHGVGGSSRTILEATDRYTPASLIEAVGFSPERFTSSRVAAALAEQAYRRARQLADDGGPLFGLGCTATIATDRAKRGEHRCQLAVRDGFGVVHYELTLRKGARDRRGEEALVSLLLLRAVADACGVLPGPELPLVAGEALTTSLESTPRAQAFAAGDHPWLLLRSDGRLEQEPAPRAVALFSGSFNPLHDGHRGLARVAAGHLGRPLLFELPLRNADKSEIALFEARRRALQFAGGHDVLLTRAPLFVEKAELFADSVFVIGADTAARIVAPRFYDDDPQQVRTALDELKATGARFLVTARQHGGELLTLAAAEVPAGYRDMFEALPEGAFRLDLSSTDIRAGWD